MRHPSKFIILIVVYCLLAIVENAAAESVHPSASPKTDWMSRNSSERSFSRDSRSSRKRRPRSTKNIRDEQPPESDPNAAAAEAVQKALQEAKQTGSQPSACLDCALAGESLATPAPRPESMLQSNQSNFRISSESSSTGEFKSSESLGRYVNCYIQNEENNQLYIQQYRPLIKEAAKSFAIPEAFLTCLLFRESRFNKAAKSGVGARGLAQFMPGTIKFVSGMVAKYDVGDSKLSELRALKSGALGYVSLRDQAYAETYIQGVEFTKNWGRYFEGIRQIGRYNGPTPRNFSLQGALTPEIAVGASAFYIRYIMEFYKERLNSDFLKQAGSDQKPNPDFLLLIAGSYNMGHGAGMKMLERAKPNSLKAWRERMNNSNKETRGYMNSISNCMKAGSFEPMQGDPWRSCP